MRTARQAGLRLHSQDFYWLVAGCESGQFHFNAWADQAPRASGFTRTTFLDFLLKHDEHQESPISGRRKRCTYMDKNDADQGAAARDYSGRLRASRSIADGIGRAGAVGPQDCACRQIGQAVIPA